MKTATKKKSDRLSKDEQTLTKVVNILGGTQQDAEMVIKLSEQRRKKRQRQK